MPHAAIRLNAVDYRILIDQYLFHIHQECLMGLTIVYVYET